MSLSATFRLVVLLGLLTALFLAVGYYFAGTAGMTMALGAALFMNALAYWFSDSFVLRMYGAKKMDAKSKEYKELNPILERLAKKAGIPKPPVYLVRTDVPNAFATGRSQQHAAVAVTKGLLETLSNKEIEGVLAHELSHVKHRDTLVATMAATLAGALTWIGYSFFFGNDENRSIFSYMLLFILAPLAATLIQLSITRSREYLADRGGAQIANPLDLASALEKISASVKAAPAQGNAAGAHLFIVNPFSASALSSLFSTHPPVEQRVQRLREMAKHSKAVEKKDAQ
ncbi:MAG: M48 family metalloprotease [Candidatus Aenigmarchaeota archaeon]|nr:M48 family metalloprotease [Candidatus Aenigmarchaeota archaeon]